jgi:hypothetical protein
MAGKEASVRLEAPEEQPALTVQAAVVAPASPASPAVHVERGADPSAESVERSVDPDTLDALDRAAAGFRPSWHGAAPAPLPEALAKALPDVAAPGVYTLSAAAPTELDARASTPSSPPVPSATFGYSFDFQSSGSSPDSTQPMDAILPASLARISGHPGVLRVRDWLLQRPRVAVASGAGLFLVLVIALWPSAPSAPEHAPPPPVGPALALAPSAQPGPALPPTPAAEQPGSEATSLQAALAAAAAEPTPAPAPLRKESARNARNKRREASRVSVVSKPSVAKPSLPGATKPNTVAPASIKKAPDAAAKNAKNRSSLAPNPYH